MKKQLKRLQHLKRPTTNTSKSYRSINEKKQKSRALVEQNRSTTSTDSTSQK